MSDATYKRVRAWAVEVWCCNTLLPSVGFYRVPARDGVFRTLGGAERHAQDYSGRRAFLVPHALYRSEIKETTRPRDFFDWLLTPFIGRPQPASAIEARRGETHRGSTAKPRKRARTP